MRTYSSLLTFLTSWNRQRLSNKLSVWNCAKLLLNIPVKRPVSQLTKLKICYLGRKGSVTLYLRVRCALGCDASVSTQCSTACLGAVFSISIVFVQLIGWKAFIFEVIYSITSRTICRHLEEYVSSRCLFIQEKTANVTRILEEN